MRQVNSFLIAFSMYSRIPVPQPDWERSSMDYVMCYFPFVGTVLGALAWLCFQGGRLLGLSPLLLGAVLTALPLWISGGIHMDGYMDTRDALASCGDKEKKLAILKDSHTGAFAVMGCGLYLLLSFGAWCAVKPGQGLLCVCLGYTVSRTLSGLSVLCFPKAKKSGSYVTMFAKRASKGRAVLFLALLLVLEGVLLLWLGGWRGGLSAAAAAAVFGWYYYMSRKQFGGITGDLAGYFVQLCELAVLLAMAVTG
ncbi:MAG TPA: adenosylcobinamide-GDP ribazoletransferase [Candidatus Dorea intestinigallinarum]|nr:adenosylcobinamide-GDP ribazoletransferase [Candidatus Dorea intestinigallinarum]